MTTHIHIGAERYCHFIDGMISGGHACQAELYHSGMTNKKSTTVDDTFTHPLSGNPRYDTQLFWL